MANLLGKRFFCEKCGTELLCTKSGNGAVKCCDKEMLLGQTKPLPSAD